MADSATREFAGRRSTATLFLRGLADPVAWLRSPRRSASAATPAQRTDMEPASVPSHQGPPALKPAIESATRALLARQRNDGHFIFELEADATIPSEYVLLVHWLGETPDETLEKRIGAYLRRIQGADGGWPLYHGGRMDISASVKAYFALKAIGDSPHSPHMVRAREAILARGGAGCSNVFTRTLLALHGAIPWHSVPMMPVEIMLLPRWFPFHLSKIAYWSRTVLVPLTVLYVLRPAPRKPPVGIDELFCLPQRPLRGLHMATHRRIPWSPLFEAIDGFLRMVEPRFPAGLRRRAIHRAVRFTTERLNGEDGLGGIFPAMANAVMMFEALGVAPDAPDRRMARRALDRLLVVKCDEAYCQPCVSPVWDTALAAHTLLEVGGERAIAGARGALAWLTSRQILDTTSDGSRARAKERPGGWAFQYNNAYYPDVDDTAVVVMAMERAAREAPHGDARDWREAIERGVAWTLSMQSRNGGFAAFDADNDHAYLNYIPFADHGALLDPPTADVTARCVSLLAQLRSDGYAHAQALDRALGFLRRTQEADGSWYGRWGMNRIYGTWSALCALRAAGAGPRDPQVRRAVHWLKSIQNPDAGWGEDAESYRLDYRGHERAPSTASQTAWALLGLMAAGCVDDPAVERGAAYLLRTQGADGFWPEERFTATGFPRVFYLRYHGYAAYFPLWALARYRNAKANGAAPPRNGM